MKIKALRDLGGVVNAHSGQELDVTEAQALDLIQQGVAMPVNASEYQTLKAMSNDELAKIREQSAFQTEEFNRAVSEAAQKVANAELDSKEEIKESIRKMAQQTAETHAQAVAQANQTHAQAEQQMAQAQAQAQQQMNQAKMDAEASHVSAMGQMHQQAKSNVQGLSAQAQSQAQSQANAQATTKATAKNQSNQ
jgi:DNA-binding transcriptional regulator YiaG